MVWWFVDNVMVVIREMSFKLARNEVSGPLWARNTVPKAIRRGTQSSTWQVASNGIRGEKRECGGGCWLLVDCWLLSVLWIYSSCTSLYSHSSLGRRQERPKSKFKSFALWTDPANQTKRASTAPQQARIRSSHGVMRFYLSPMRRYYKVYICCIEDMGYRGDRYGVQGDQRVAEEQVSPSSRAARWRPNAASCFRFGPNSLARRDRVFLLPFAKYPVAAEYSFSGPSDS